MEYIAALDLGTSKMLAMAASKDDRQKILATKQIESGDSMRRGFIYKTTEASAKIAELIQCLNQELQEAHLPVLKQVYVGIGGKGLHTKAYSVEKNIHGNIVDDEILDQLRDECQADWNGTFELIEKTSPEYFIDGHPESQPQGVRCKKIEARFQLVLGHFSEFKTEVEKALRKESVEIADIFVSPIATAKQVLTEKEKRYGCALIEFGAGVTYLSVYHSGLLRYLVTIPLGGNAITQDIRSLDRVEEEAEELKINEGSAWFDDKTNELNNLIEARADEIIANILRQIDISGYGQALNAGFILTGGTSRLEGLDSLLRRRTDKPIRRVEEFPEQSCVRGLLQSGNENCAKETGLSSPTPTRRKLWDDILGYTDEIQQPKIKKTKTGIIKGIKEKAEEVTKKGAGILFDFD